MQILCAPLLTLMAASLPARADEHADELKLGSQSCRLAVAASTTTNSGSFLIGRLRAKVVQTRQHVQLTHTTIVKGATCSEITGRTEAALEAANGRHTRGGVVGVAALDLGRAVPKQAVEVQRTNRMPVSMADAGAQVGGGACASSAMRIQWML